MIRQKRRCSPIIAGNLALDKEKVMDCDSDLMTDDDSSFLTCSSGRGEDTSLPGQMDMDQLNMCMTKLKVDDTKLAPRTPSNNRNQGSQANPIIPGVINVKGYRKCFKGCGTCMVVSIEPEGQRFFQSSVTLKTYPLPDTKVNCSSSNLIYLISCSACGKQYVGKSFTSLKVHHDKHRTQIRHKSEGVGKHFSSCGYECLKLQIIEVCNKK